MKMPIVCEILCKFKNLCTSKGWKTSEKQDWVETGDAYHNFLWARDVPLSSFKRIALSKKCVVPEGLNYSVAECSYTAWIFSKSPSETLIRTVLEDQKFSEVNAVYDLSPFLEGKHFCAKLNLTASAVFHEFEDFLKTELKVKFKSFSSVPDSSVNHNAIPIDEIA